MSSILRARPTGKKKLKPAPLPQFAWQSRDASQVDRAALKVARRFALPLHTAIVIARLAGIGQETFNHG